MSGSVNKVIIVGRLGKDPDVRYTQDNRKIVNLSVATSESWKDKNTGEKRERVEWHKVVIFNEGIANVAEKYLHKGSSVYLEGALQTRKWQGQDGQDRYSTEIVLQGFSATLVMLDGLGGRDEDKQCQPTKDDHLQSRDNWDGTLNTDLEDEIPF